MAPPNGAALVERIKQELERRGIIPSPQSTNEHAAAITWRVAWQMRDDGARLIPKAPGENGATHPTRGRFSHDAIAFPDGWVDCLASAGPPANENRPVWQWKPGRFPTTAAPWDLDEELAPAPGVDPGAGEETDGPPPGDAAPAIPAALVDAVTALAGAIDGLKDALEALAKNGVRVRLG